MAKSESELHQSLAQSNFNDCIMTEKLYNWSPICIEASKITLHYKGSIPQLDFIGTFEEVPSGRVKFCSQSLRLEHSTTRKLNQKYSKYSSGILSYFEDKISFLRRELAMMDLESSSLVCHMVHYIDWYISRIEMTGKELSILENRFKGKVYMQNEKDGSHYLEMQFNKESGDEFIVGCFEICDSYPFAGLDVTIKGNVDVEALERHLSKNSKPGFGYLSRTCDVFSVFCKSSI